MFSRQAVVFSKGKPDVHYVHPDRRQREGRGPRERKMRLEKAGDRGIEVVNPSPACLPVFCWQHQSQPLQSGGRDKGRRGDEARKHLHADARKVNI